MRRLQISTLAALGALSLAACTQPAPPAPAAPPPPTHADIVARGQYLVTGLAGCNDCHTRMTPTGPDMAHSLQGAPLPFGPIAHMPWAPVAPPIAGGPGGFTEAQLATFLQTGTPPEGVTPPKPPMPPYRMNAEDAAAVAAYVWSLPKA